MSIAASDVIAAVAGVLGVHATALDPHEDLLLHGLDSISAMSLAGQWRCAGSDVRFIDLLDRPRLADWVAMVAGENELYVGELTEEMSSSAESEDGSEPFDLATMQHAYWVGRQPGQRLGGVAAHFYNEFDGHGVDPARLEAAVLALLARHEMLRVAIGTDGRQRILPASPWAHLRVHDFRDDPAGLETLRAELSHRLLDVAMGEVFDIRLSHTPGGTRVHVNLDMLAADAQSLRILFSDLAALYRHPQVRLPELTYGYTRYLADHTRREQDSLQLPAAREYWGGRVPDLPGAPALPESGVEAGPRVTRKHHWLTVSARAQLENRARRCGLTPALAIAAVFAEVIAAWSGQDEFLLNLPLFDREPLHPDVAALVGDFTSSILLAVDATEPGTFAQRARALQARFRADAAHAAYPGVDVLRDLSRHNGEPVLAPIVYTSALGLGELFDATVRECFGDPAWIISQGPQVTLDAQVTEFDGGLLVNWDARADAFADGVLDAMFGAYIGMLDTLVADETAWDLPVPELLPADQRAVRAAVNATEGPGTATTPERSGSQAAAEPDGSGPVTLHERFFALAAAQPDEPAVLWGADGCLTYGELAWRARAVAQTLPAGHLIPVHLPKGPEQIVRVLGILAAGSAYLPVGIDQPAHRRDRILAAAGPLTGDAGIAYVIHTSGSTGAPKGVQIPHAAAVNTIGDLIDRFELSANDRTLAVAALDFDLSVFDIFAPLIAGGAVVLVGEEERRDPTAWADLIIRHRVTVLNCVPAVLDMLVTSCPALPLRLVLVGGDRVATELPARLRAVAGGCVFAALGGTTETAIHSTVQIVDEVAPDWSSVPYGVPLRNVRCRVVDAFGRDRPDWVPGELWIGGAGLALGYLGDPERTRAKFADGWYRTGDVARYRPDGTLEFLGRADHQVKIRGHRIEPGEIDAALAAHPAVGQAVTVPVGRGLAAAVTPAAAPVAPAALDPGCAPADDQIPVVRATLDRLLAELASGAPALDRYALLLERWRKWLHDHDSHGQDPTVAVLDTVPLLEVLRGEREPLTLLDHPVHAPRALLWSLPQTAAACDSVLAAIRAAWTEAGRALVVAELGDYAGERLLEALRDDPHLPPDAVRYHRVSVRGPVPEALYGQCDLVLAFATLHAHPDPSAGLGVAAYLLRSDGRFVLVEQPELPPLGLITAAILEDGFPQGDPMLSPARWQRLLAGAGFAIEQAMGYGSLFALAARWTGTPIDIDELTQLLADRLPAVMHPDRLRILPRMPLSSNGKIDRAALTVLLGEDGATPAVTAARTSAERRVAEIWSAILGVDSIGREQDFFALGGDSLLATRMVSRFPGRKLADLYAHRTLAAFAATLGDGERALARTVTADPGARHDLFLASDIQRAYWIGRGSGAALGGVGTHYYSEFHCPGIDMERLEGAWRALIARHEMLRAVFGADGNQRILPVENLPEWHVRGTDGDVREQMSHQVLDPGVWPLFDVRLGAGDRLGISLDNIVLDGLSMMILFSELDRLYGDPGTTLAPIEVSFRDYMTQIVPANTPQSQQYWRDRIPQLPPAPRPPLRLDPATLTHTPRFVRRAGLLPAGPWHRLRDTARDCGVTPTALLLACYGEVLAAWSGRGDVTVNVTLFDREQAHPHIDRVLGDFTSLLFTEYRSADSIVESARLLHERMWSDLDHRDVSPMWVLRELARHHGEQVGFPVVFTSALGVAGNGLSLDPSSFGEKVWAISQTPQVWMDLQVHESGGGLHYALDTVDELFCDGVVDAMFTAFENLLGATATGTGPHPDTRTAPERGIGPGAPRRGLLHTAFFAQPRDSVALVHDGREISYGELARQALRIAGALPRDEVIAVSLPKGPDQIAAVLGVLAAGSAYLPIGVDQPAARRARVLAAAGARLVIDDIERYSGATPLSVPVPVDPGALAYVIYTSGSTGDPKGVEITHAAAYNTVTDINERYGIDATDSVLAVSALDFDLSVYDVFGLLSAGGRVVMIGEDQRRDAQAWSQLVTGHGVTVWNTVPTLLDMLLVAHGGDADSVVALPLRIALSSGDWVGLDLPGRLHAAAAGCRFVALGGATEAAIWSNACEVTEVPAHWTSIPYGRALRGQRYRVVDALGRDCPDWVCGELWIGGAGLARGYRGDPALTAVKFVHSGGERWYRTGDQGRFWPDGTLEFLGRTDHQVKIRGHRVELGEIEAALVSHPDVADGVAIAIGERAQRRLVAFVVPPAGAAPGQLDIEALGRLLRTQLPPYAVPATLVCLDALPLTGNGKVDRRALAERSLTAERTSAEPPAGRTEQVLVTLLGELLHLTVGRNDNFFVLGCDSLTVTRLTERLRREHRIHLTLREVFATPTVADLAGVIDAQRFEEGKL
ncbi:amino acid adenylation domain-containing protein [Rhodococcus maanshanensis]|uniref:non-ribosomal peptide synthetase n=1 Tax=Rhodococcus maanshanensis TaxID=183556 RepID=UPI0022B3CC11|nr:non-ribosomal peptide synthetase [Rhodococcus maanshanensis]MCZ4556785.1 amino acid adenylation domain-containing protein [Rhodococcus maanshanensis]